MTSEKDRNHARCKATVRARWPGQVVRISSEPTFQMVQKSCVSEVMTISNHATYSRDWDKLELVISIRYPRRKHCDTRSKYERGKQPRTSTITKLRRHPYFVMRLPTNPIDDYEHSQRVPMKVKLTVLAMLCSNHVYTSKRTLKANAATGFASILTPRPCIARLRAHNQGS